MSGTTTGGSTNTGGTTGAAGTTKVNPATGQVESVSGNDTTTTADGQPAQAVLVGSVKDNTWVPATLACLAILAAVAAPPTISVVRRRRRI